MLSSSDSIENSSKKVSTLNTQEQGVNVLNLDISIDDTNNSNSEIVIQPCIEKNIFKDSLNAETFPSTIVEEINDFSIHQMLQFSNDKKFPKKQFIIAGRKRYFTNVTHFFECQTKFDVVPNENISFTCKAEKCCLKFKWENLQT